MILIFISNITFSGLAQATQGDRSTRDRPREKVAGQFVSLRNSAQNTSFEEFLESLIHVYLNSVQQMVSGEFCMGVSPDTVC